MDATGLELNEGVGGPGERRHRKTEGEPIQDEKTRLDCRWRQLVPANVPRQGWQDIARLDFSFQVAIRSRARHGAWLAREHKPCQSSPTGKAISRADRDGRRSDRAAQRDLCGAPRRRSRAAAAYVRYVCPGLHRLASFGLAQSETRAAMGQHAENLCLAAHRQAAGERNQHRSCPAKF